MGRLLLGGVIWLDMVCRDVQMKRERGAAVEYPIDTLSIPIRNGEYKDKTNGLTDNREDT